MAPDGTVWVSGGGGVFSFDGVEWTRRFDHSAGGVAVAPDGTVWIGGGPWLARWDDGSWIPVTAFGWTRQEPHGHDRLWLADTPRTPTTSDGPSLGWRPRMARCGWSRYVQWLARLHLAAPLRRGHRVAGRVRRHHIARRRLGSTGPCDDTFVDVEAAPNGDVWTLLDPHDTGEWLVARFDGEVWTTYTPPFDLDALVADRRAQWRWGRTGGCGSLLEDGLVSFDGTDWTTHLQGQEVSALDVAPDGTVWYIDEDGAHTLGEGASP